MREKLLRKIKQNKAFTLMEMLIVVAIMVVLLGISIVAITDWTKTMKMTELDSYAKMVYLEAQNQLASLETEGSLSKLNNDLSVEGGQYYDDYHLRKGAYVPADYNVEEYGSFYQGLYYFTDQDTVITIFVPEISLSDDEGCYLVELHPATGDVYGVFYWENGNEYIGNSDSEEICTKLCRMEQASKDTNNRGVASRSEYLIGYYGGNGGETMSTSSYELNQQVTIVNEEELYVKISYDYNGRVIEHINGDTKPFDIEISILGETSGEEWIPEFDIKDNYVVKNGRIETGFLLDGLGTNQNFVSIIADAGKNFIPGENLKITVKTVYLYDNVKLKEKSSTYTVNSLFHDVSDKVVDDGNETLVRTIGVSSVRHLRNLDETYYHGDIVKYKDGEEIGSYVILQKDDIDYSKGTYAFEGRAYVVEKEVDDVVYSLSRPTSFTFSPINNSLIFESGTKNVIVNGGTDFAIKNLVVSAGSDNAGLFAKTKNVDFVNVKLEDYTLNASGCNNVGALVGYAEGGHIDHSGVYLAPFYRNGDGIKQYYNQESDSTYGNKMAAHYAEMTVTGNVNVGGLVGRADQTIISDCYAAVQVKGTSTVGGLVGFANGKITQDANVYEIDTNEEIEAVVTVQNCYASGVVVASAEEAGGLIGYAKNLCVYNAYASGDVYCNSQTAGFVGDSDHGYYKKCSSYGEVLNASGSNAFTSNAVVGGFISSIKDNNGDISTLGYLSQVGYNADTVFGDATLLKKEYKDFTSTVANTSAAKSYPYDGNLLYKAFPFEMVTDHHYGDWATQYFINTSLVYYEKYADGSYGYYSVTKLTDNSDEDSEASKYVWVLNSLRDETCKEDGYALLTMFYLDSVNYSVYQYVDGDWLYAKTDGNNDENTKLLTGTLSVSEREYGSDKMVRLAQQGALVFNAYEEVENPYSANYDGQTIKSSFVTNGMYLYQLPYELQNTYRYNVDNFYDVIVFDEGYAVGNLKSENEDEVGGTPVISNEVYYYCPHFAKLAINPGLGVSESSTDFVQLDAPYTVSVRSARQLNALGRVPYYWNDKGGGTELVTYSQEVDINFSTYADFGSGKTYCGRTYNLLAFDTEYENEPIGQNAQDDGYGAFQNDYNGNCHKIIDYCVKSSNQYVGLFGEIYKEGGATQAQISNVVMVVSSENKGNKGNYETEEEKQNNAGLIIGTYQDKGSGYSDSSPRTGVGALVGSDYTIGTAYTSETLAQNENSIIYTIYNCAVAGYQVQYHIKAVSSGYQQPLGIALGGMIGYSRGNVAHASAINDVTLVARENLTGSTAAIAVGGFSGSSFFGTTLNCYSGGTINVDDVDEVDGKKVTYAVTRLRIGGFCPGWLYASGLNKKDDSDADVSYINVYSYTQLDSHVKEINETFTHFFPTVSRMRLYYEYRWLSGGLKWHTDYDNGDKAVSVHGLSYYLQTDLTAEYLSGNEDDAKRYYEYYQDLVSLFGGDDCPKTCDPATYYQLSNFDWLTANTSSWSEGDEEWENKEFVAMNNYSELQKAKISVPYSQNENSTEYPFPAYVVDENGNYIHYGDWIDVPTDRTIGYEEQKNTGFNVGYGYDNYRYDPIMKSDCQVYKNEDGSYYVEFSFTKEEILAATVSRQSNGLYIKWAIPGWTYNRQQVYLNLGDNGVGTATVSSNYDAVSGSIRPDVVYRLWIYGIDTSKGIGNQNITWELEEK